MVSISGKALEILNQTENRRVKLVGIGRHILNIIEKEEVEIILPGGLEFIGEAIFDGGAPEEKGVFILRENNILVGCIWCEGEIIRTELNVQEYPLTVFYSSAIFPQWSFRELELITEEILYELKGTIVQEEIKTNWKDIKPDEINELIPLFPLSNTDSQGPILTKNQQKSQNLPLQWTSSVNPAETSFPEMLRIHTETLKKILLSTTSHEEKPEKILSFYNDYSSHPIMLSFPLSQPNKRKIIEALHFPPDWPLLDHHCFIKPRPGFKDVHLPLLKPSQKDIGRKHCIKGHYLYFHYMQDMDDRGWGCAYRSLQTIISWFKFQYFTEKEIPIHTEIQTILFENGDKPREFVGSREWIGAFELMLVLDIYCGVSSRIMNFNSGSEVEYRARELALHFEEEGTPVMIGGGVLAYTLLGVEYNEETGESKYLILDPHYTGEDVVKTVLDKGWCGWKTPDIFRADAHYNFCMPTRPRIVI